MAKVKRKLVAPPSVREFFAQCGSKGGRAKTAKKVSASRKNGFAPCRPGKARGRPVAQENKSDETEESIMGLIKKAELVRKSSRPLQG